MAKRLGPGALTYTGLREMRAALRGMDPELARGLTHVHKTISLAAVAGMRMRAESRTHPRVGHQAIGTLRATAGQQSASVKYGNAETSWALGEEFGSLGARMTVDRRHPRGRHSTRQFPAWRGNKQGAGYFVWPTIREDLPRFIDAYDEMVEELLAEAFPPAGRGGA